MTRAISASVSVRVRGVSAPPVNVPQWVSSAPLRTWTELPGTKLESAQVGLNPWSTGTPQQVCSYSGATLRDYGSEVFLCGGGHADYAGNEMYSLRLADAAPVWKRRIEPTPPSLIPWTSGTPAPGSYYADGRPAARHTYWQIQFIDSLDKLFLFGCSATWGTGNENFRSLDEFDPATNTWKPKGTYPDVLTSRLAGGVVKTTGDIVYTHSEATGILCRWTPDTKVTVEVGPRGVANIDVPWAFDPIRNRIVRAEGGTGAPASTFDLNNNAVRASIAFIGPYAAKASQYSQMTWCDELRCFLVRRFFGDPDVYTVDPVTWAVDKLALSGTPPSQAFNSSGVSDYSYGRFMVVPRLKIVIAISGNVKQNVFFFRIA